jgi:hypothetical protein
LEFLFKLHGIAFQADATLKDFHLPDDNSALYALHICPPLGQFQYTKLGLIKPAKKAPFLCQIVACRVKVERGWLKFRDIS